MPKFFETPFIIFLGCHGTYQFDLFRSVGIPGISTISSTPGSQFIDFSKYSGNAIYTNSTEVAFILHAFMNSDDISFAVKFIIDQMELTSYTFFTIKNAKSNEEFLKISLDFIREGTVETDVGG